MAATISKTLSEGYEGTEDEESGLLNGPIRRKPRYYTGAAAVSDQVITNLISTIEVIPQQKYRYTPDASKYWPLQLMPYEDSEVVAVLTLPCLVTAVARQGNWLKVRTSGKEGWAYRLHSDGKEVLSKVESYRRFEDWAGFNTFCCGGRIMFGSDICLFILSNVFITGSSIIFIFTVCLHFARPSTRMGLIVVDLVLWALGTAFLWAAALTDPGIIPPNLSPTRAEPPIGVEVGTNYGYKYCDSCNVFRPPRSKHCSSCNNCVRQFDHHCPYIGSCVGLRNYRYFIVFIFMMCCYTVNIAVISLLLLVETVQRNEMKADGKHDPAAGPPAFLLALFGEPCAILGTIIGLMMSWAMVTLFSYHVYIMSIGQTTNERVRDIYQDHPNEYDVGCWRNVLGVFCDEIPPSLVPNMSERIYNTHKDAPAAPEGRGMVGAVARGAGDDVMTYAADGGIVRAVRVLRKPENRPGSSGRRISSRDEEENEVYDDDLGGGVMMGLNDNGWSSGGGGGGGGHGGASRISEDYQRRGGGIIGVDHHSDDGSAVPAHHNSPSSGDEAIAQFEQRRAWRSSASSSTVTGRRVIDVVAKEEAGNVMPLNASLPVGFIPSPPRTSSPPPPPRPSSISRPPLRRPAGAEDERKMRVISPPPPPPRPQQQDDDDEEKEGGGGGGREDEEGVKRRKVRKEEEEEGEEEEEEEGEEEEEEEEEEEGDEEGVKKRKVEKEKKEKKGEEGDEEEEEQEQEQEQEKEEEGGVKRRKVEEEMIT